MSFRSSAKGINRPMNIEEAAAEHVCEGCPAIKTTKGDEIDPGYYYCEDLESDCFEPWDERCRHNKWYEDILAAWEGDL